MSCVIFHAGLSHFTLCVHLQLRKTGACTLLKISVHVRNTFPYLLRNEFRKPRFRLFTELVHAGHRAGSIFYTLNFGGNNNNRGLISVYC
jgi:hypothetical protein